MEDHQFAGSDALVRRLPARRIDVAVANGAVWIRPIEDGQLRLENAVPSAQILRLLDNAANCGPRTYVLCGLTIQGKIRKQDYR